MLIGIDNNDLQNFARVVEPDSNSEASDYLIQHYKDLIKVVKSCDIKDEKAHDLLHDVFLSIIEAEENGEGFDMEYGRYNSKEDDSQINIMTVEQFVIGRIKLYSKNSKYKTEVIETSGCSVNTVTTYYETELDSEGHEILRKDGTKKLTKKVVHDKVSLHITCNAASFNEGGDVVDNNDDFQKAFAAASVADSTDDIAEMLSIREQINYCVDVCSLHGINLINILKNIDTLAEMLGTQSKKKRTAESVFSKLSELVNYHDELANNLMEVIMYSAKNKPVFDKIIQEY